MAFDYVIRQYIVTKAKKYDNKPIKPIEWNFLRRIFSEMGEKSNDLRISSSFYESTRNYLIASINSSTILNSKSVESN